MATRAKRSFPLSVSGSSVLMVFVVLCLTLFGVLSLVTAHSEWKLAQKNAQQVSDVYQDQSVGDSFLFELAGRASLFESNVLGQAEAYLTGQGAEVLSRAADSLTARYTVLSGNRATAFTFAVYSDGRVAVLSRQTTVSPASPSPSSPGVWRPQS